MSVARPTFSKRDGQLGFGAALTADLASFDQDEVLQVEKVNPAELKLKELEAKLLSGDVPLDRSGVDNLVYEA